MCAGLTSRPLWLVEEGRDENTGVQVERGMPPPVREIQHLLGGGGGAQGLVGGVWSSLAPFCHLLTSPAWTVHSKGLADGARVGYMS